MATVFPSAMQRNAVLMAAQDSAGPAHRANSATPTENASAHASQTVQENTVVKTGAGDNAEHALLERHVAHSSSVQQEEGEVTAAVVVIVLLHLEIEEEEEGKVDQLVVLEVVEGILSLKDFILSKRMVHSSQVLIYSFHLNQVLYLSHYN